MSPALPTPWRGPAVPDDPDPRPLPARWRDRLRRGPYERSRVTLTGWLFIGLMLALGGAAYNSGNNLLFLALSFLLSCLILNGLLAWSNFGGVAWRLHGPRCIRGGDTAELELELANRRQWLPAAALFFEITHSQSAEGPLNQKIPGTLGPGQTNRVPFSLQAARRGAWEIRVHRVGSPFPFGFIRKAVLGETSLTIIVRPPPVKMQVHPVPAASLRGDLLPSRKAGNQGDVLGIRAYRDGDPPKAIHWKASARAGKLLIREMAQENAPQVTLRLSLSTQDWPDEAAFEHMLSLAAELCLHWGREGVLAAVGWQGYTRTIRRLGDLDDVLDQLALATRQPPASLPSPPLRMTAVAHLRPLPRGQVGAFLHDQLVALSHR